MSESSGGFGPDARVFVISVAAELSGLHPQTLRTYDRLGIVQAGRTGGGGRRYSMRDVELLRWLFTPDDTLPVPGSPMDCILAGHKTEIRRRAMETAF